MKDIHSDKQHQLHSLEQIGNKNGCKDIKKSGEHFLLINRISVNWLYITKKLMKNFRKQ